MLKQNHAQKVIRESFAALGLNSDTTTDPRIMQAVIEEMGLDDFHTTFAPVKNFLEEVTSRPQQIGSVLETTISGITAKHPAIVEFAEIALKKNWLQASPSVLRCVHVAFVLEHITAAMCNNHQFFSEALNHFRKKEVSYGLNSRNTFGSIRKVFATTHNAFETIKSISVDPYMIYFQLCRGLGKTQFTHDELRSFYKENNLNYLEYKLLLPSDKGMLSHMLEFLKINIYEAGITEYKNGFKTNSIAAFELNEDISNNPPAADFIQENVLPERYKHSAFYESITSPRNLFPVVRFSQKWCSLYVSWNIAFLLGNLNDLDILLPKLLIPSLVGAKSENFLGIRAISLWLSMNTFFFRRCAEKDMEDGPQHKTEMAKELSRINKKYAVELAKRETHEASRTLMNHYRHAFAHPIYNLIRLFGIFLR